MGGELEKQSWSNCYLGLYVYSALCTWRRRAFYGLVQEGLISSGQQYPVQHQVKSQDLSPLAWVLEIGQIPWFCKRRLLFDSSIQTLSLSIHNCFDFLFGVLQELKIDNQEPITPIFILKTEKQKFRNEPTFTQLLSNRDRGQTQEYPGICNMAAKHGVS